ncbi:uncharacterized protein LOC130949296 [Arachis stenosperma]|uniref:uncharacterized protein LOC130949296 n=1 Tax=Arachis stenosperma TaxID=217475 RepID=UPI0025ACBDA5|nr:uncharacterized protein LOC130949296 [Arachis stenosperma]
MKVTHGDVTFATNADGDCGALCGFLKWRGAKLNENGNGVTNLNFRDEQDKKVLVNRFRLFLLEIIGPLQGGFISGRGTTENIIIAQEIMHFKRNTKYRKRTMAFKIDLEKAYDRIDRLQNFNPKRELRQGDPMSPYLFVLYMKMLACFISHKVFQGLWILVAISRNGPRLSHLMFTDDLLLFCNASKAQVIEVMHCLDLFSRASGLKVNLHKSKAQCSKRVLEKRKEVLSGVSNIHFCNDLDTYLKINIGHARASRKTAQEVIEKILRKLSSWKGCLLNKAGRLCLVKSVMASILVYEMQISLLPKYACNKIDSLMRQFLWKGQATGKGLPLVRWEVAITPKRAEGLGIRDTTCANMALLKKLVWDCLNNSEKLWVQVLKHKYLRNQSGMNANSRNSSSATWKNIVSAYEHLKEGLHWNIGNKGVSWEVDSLTMPILHEIKQFICGLRYPSSTELEPKWECWPAATKKYSAREGYRWLLEKTLNWNANSNWNWLWNTNISEKFKFTMWLSLHDALPTETFRFKRHLASSDMCKRCNKAQETMEHCLRDCERSKAIWHMLDPSILDSTAGTALEKWFHKALANNEASFGAGLWWVWRHRCNDIFNTDNLWTDHKRDLGILLEILREIGSRAALEAFPPSLSSDLTSGYLSEVTDLVHKIQELLSRPWLVHIEWVSREANRAADWMARYGAKSNSNHVIWSEPCADHQQIILSDIG